MEREVIPGEPRFISTKEAAAKLGVLPTKLNQFARDNLLVVIRREGGGVIPEEMLMELGEVASHDVDLADAAPAATHEPVPGLRGTITLLRDGGFEDMQIVDWMWSPDEELGAAPIELLRAGRHHAVNRVAATLGL